MNAKKIATLKAKIEELTAAYDDLGLTEYGSYAHREQDAIDTKREALIWELEALEACEATSRKAA